MLAINIQDVINVLAIVKTHLIVLGVALVVALAVIVGTIVIALFLPLTKIIEKLQLQQQTQFHKGEFDVNVQGLMSAMEPFEMQHYALVKALMAA